MKKRLREKLNNSYNALYAARRQRYKRKGIKCVTYELIPIGDRDRLALINDELSPDYRYATHWLIDAYVSDGAKIRIFPCSNNGATRSISPVRMIIFFEKDVEQVLDTFSQVIEDMKADRFWSTIY